MTPEQPILYTDRYEAECETTGSRDPQEWEHLYKTFAIVIDARNDVFIDGEWETICGETADMTLDEAIEWAEEFCRDVFAQEIYCSA